MLAGDKIYHKFLGKNVRKLLNTGLVDSIASAFDEDDEIPSENAPRQLQLNAFVAVNTDLTVTYSHYCKTIANFPGVKELISGLKK